MKTSQPNVLKQNLICGQEKKDAHQLMWKIIKKMCSSQMYIFRKLQNKHKSENHYLTTKNFFIEKIHSRKIHNVRWIYSNIDICPVDNFHSGFVSTLHPSSA